MVKSKKKAYSFLALFLSVLMLVSMFSIFSFTKPETKVSASELTDDQIAQRRAKPGLYETDTANLLASWDDLITKGIVNIQNGKISIATDISTITDKEYADLVLGKITETITSLENMCYDEENGIGCAWLNAFDFNGLDTSTVTSMRNLFNYCFNVTSIEMSKINTNKVTDMSYMFGDCYYLVNVDVSSFNTKNVVDMSGLFSSCSELKHLDLRAWNTASVTNMCGMFSSCSSLTDLNISNFDTSNVTDMSYMFSGCSALNNLNLANFNTRKVIDMSRMFQSCKSLSSLDLSNFDTTVVTDFKYMFTDCSNLIELNLSNLDIGNVPNGDIQRLDIYLFSGCSSLKKLDLRNWKLGNISSTQNWFFRMNALEILDLSNWDTSNIVNMSYMFDELKALKLLRLSNWDTSGVTNMSSMFSACYSLSSLDLSSFDISKVNTYNMIKMCTALTRIKLPKVMGTKSITLPTASTGNHFALTDAKETALTTITSAHAGKVLELFDANNVSLAPEEPDVPSTGVTANVLGAVVTLVIASMIAYVCTNKKRKILEK